MICESQHTPHGLEFHHPPATLMASDSIQHQDVSSGFHQHLEYDPRRQLPLRRPVINQHETVAVRDNNIVCKFILHNDIIND